MHSHVVVTIQLHQILDTERWRVRSWIRLAENTSLGEVRAQLVLRGELLAKVGDGEVVGPDFAVGALDGLVLCFLSVHVYWNKNLGRTYHRWTRIARQSCRRRMDALLEEPRRETYRTPTCRRRRDDRHAPSPMGRTRRRSQSPRQSMGWKSRTCGL